MIDGLILEGVTGTAVDMYSPASGVELTDFDPQYETRNDETAKVQQDGLWATYDYLGKVTIHMEGHILGSSGADYWQKRIALASVFVPAPQLGFRYVVNVRAQFTGWSEEVSMQCQMDGRPDLPIMADFPAMSAFQIALKGADPRFYGAIQSAETSAPVAPPGGTGFTFPLTFPLSFLPPGEVITGGDLFLQTQGNAFTAPLAQITGPCSSPALTAFDGLGNAFTINLFGLTLGPASSAFVDFGARTVTSDLGNNLFQYVSGTWWMLPPNSITHVKFTCMDADSDTNVVFTWQNAYLL